MISKNMMRKIALALGFFVLFGASEARAQGSTNILDGAYLGFEGGYSFSTLNPTYNGAQVPNVGLHDDGIHLGAFAGLGTVFDDRYFVAFEFAVGTHGQGSAKRTRSFENLRVSLDHEYALASYVRAGFFVDNDALIYLLFGWARSSYDMVVRGTDDATKELDIQMDGFAYGGGIEYPVLENFNARVQYRVTDYWEGKGDLAPDGTNYVGTRARGSIEHNFTIGLGYQF